MSTPNNPHDKLFKATFSEKALVIEFIEHFLPPTLNQDIGKASLSLQPISYLTPALTEYYSDIVYSCKFGKGEIEIALLFEHKSFVPQYPHLQILRYMVEAWTHMVSQEKP